ncbi:MAG: hypothetical protein RIB43_12550 [Rhodospirillaceae bacterium]
MAVRGELGTPFSIPIAAAPRRGDQSLWLFLSLYLLLFAFFIVLNSFSTFDSGRRDAVINSVLDAFAQISGPGSQQDLGGTTGNEFQARRFQDAVTDIFESAIPLANLRVAITGTRMEVDVPSQVFFEDDSVVVRNPLPMLDRIVATVSSPPFGTAYELSVIARVPAQDGDTLPINMTADIARVGNIARALDARGMPPKSLSIGLDEGDGSAFTLIFFAVEEGVDRVVMPNRSGPGVP